MDTTLEAFTNTNDLSRIQYHHDLEKVSRACGPVHGERRGARDAAEAEAALCDDESRWYREALTETAKTWPPALRAMVFGG